MNDLQKQIIKCQQATPLQFEALFTEYKDLLKKEISLEGKDFFEIMNQLIEYITYFEENKIDNPQLLDTLIQQWDGESAEGADIEGVIGDLAATIQCTQKNLNYICETLKTNINILSILDLHIRTRYGTGMIFSLVAERLLKAFNLKNLEDFQWDHLEDTVSETLKGFNYDPRFISRENYSEKRNSQDVILYIQSKHKEKNKEVSAPVPKWISLKEEESVETYKDRDIGSSKEEDEKELEGMKELFEKTVNVKKQSETNPGDIAETNPSEIAELIVALKENTRDLNARFPVERFYGPANSILGKECSGINGPCRMFYCVCREDIDYEDVSYLEELDPQSWFIEKCEECERKIQKFRHAVRFPVTGGGWIGCFCSFNCLYKSKIRPIFDNDDLLIKEIKKFMEKFGVADL